MCDGDDVCDGVLDGDEPMFKVCPFDAIGDTSQLVPSEIARSAPPIFSLVVAKPMLSAVRSLNTTSPSSGPATNIFWSAMLMNNAHSPLFMLSEAGSVNVTPLPPRVVNTDPKSSDVTV